MRKIDERPVAYSYVRMSSKRQIKGDSMRRQLELSAKYAEEHNLRLDEQTSFADKGVSAWTGANVTDGALGRFLEAAKRGDIKAGSYLLVESLDRLSRQQVRSALVPFMELINADIIIVTLADKQVYSKATVDANFTQLIISLTIMARAHEESETKSQRLKAVAENRRNNAAKGIGRFSQMNVGWIDAVKVGHEQYEFKLNQHADTVRRIFELADSGVGQVIIARRLNEAKVPTFRGKATWYDANINRIIRNEAVIGTYQPTRVVDGVRQPFGLPIKNYYPAVISDELFWRVQRQDKVSHARGRHKGNRITNLFSGRIQCFKCQGPVRLRVGGKRFYFHCDNRYRTSSCDCSGMFRYDVAEKVLFDHILELSSASDNDVPVDEAARSRVQNTIDDHTAALRNAERGYENLLALAELADDEFTRRDIAAKLAKRRKEVEQHKAHLSELHQDLSDIDTRRKELASIAEQIHMERLLWTTGSEEEVFNSRARVSRMLNRFITGMRIDFDTKRLMIAVTGGLRLFTFDASGALVETVDFSHQIATGTDHFHFDLAGADPDLHVEREKLIREFATKRN